MLCDLAFTQNRPAKTSPRNFERAPRWQHRGEVSLSRVVDADDATQSIWKAIGPAPPMDRAHTGVPFALLVAASWPSPCALLEDQP
jgi:hypothetical protein